jgi:hypothetical protein
VISGDIIMYRLWSERPVPAKFTPLLSSVTVSCGAAGAPRERVFDSVGDAQAVIASSLSRYDGAFADRFPMVRVICRTGIGVDNVVVQEMTARGVAVCNAPDAPTVPGLILHRVASGEHQADHALPIERSSCPASAVNLSSPCQYVA